MLCVWLSLGNIELVKELLSRGVPVDSQSESGTPLIWAAGHDQKEAVEVLLEHNANVNSCVYIFFNVLKIAMWWLSVL